MLIHDTVPTREQSRAAELASRARKLSICDGEGYRRTWDTERVRINEGILQYHFGTDQWRDLGRVDTLIANGWTIEPSKSVAFIEECRYRGDYAIQHELRTKFSVHADASGACVISRVIGVIDTLWATNRMAEGDYLADELYRAVSYVGCGDQREEVTDSDGNVAKVPSAKVVLRGEDGYSFNFIRYTPVAPARYREVFNTTNKDWTWGQRKAEANNQLRVQEDLNEVPYRLNCSVEYRFQFNGGIIRRWDYQSLLSGVGRDQRGWSIHT